MKKVIFSAIILASTALGAKAQTGSVLVGGDVDFKSITTPSGSNDIKQNIISFNPTIGYQFTDHITAGITGAVSSDKTTQGNVENKITGLSGGPFIRYAEELSNIFSVYGQLQATFGTNKNTSVAGPISTTSKSNSTSVDLFPAAFINLKNNFGLNFNFGGISYNSVKPSGQKSTNTFDVNFGKVATIGISKNFGGGKK
ncbi:MAG: outer membrane beta-barrel protein [Bacteroidetes bacterium]|nr:outer membrane beta-barrel protein [Bacteroidota bacterium]MBS1756057.1 outer membrane beta-barrel protein [Bacteroidota bacterium]